MKLRQFLFLHSCRKKKIRAYSELFATVPCSKLCKRLLETGSIQSFYEKLLL